MQPSVNNPFEADCVVSSTARRHTIGRVQQWLSIDVPCHSLVFFRICFGFLMAIWALDYLRTGRVQRLCSPGAFHFTYDGFSWVRPWPGDGMTLMFGLLLLSAILIAVGAIYRTATLTFACGFTHFFLIERTNYQNHYYLIILLSWLLVLLPANRLWSVDVLNKSVSRSTTVPRWALWLLQFHIALPYVFGGIAKLDPDWLSGEPMKNILRIQGWSTVFARWFSEGMLAMAFTWGGLLFDILIVPALLYRRTRVFAFLLAVAFHVSNSLMFRIHIFPWLMVAATTVFFEPNWIERFWPTRNELVNDALKTQPTTTWQLISRPAVGLLLMYCGFHLLWPLRHHLYEGHTGWTERGHYFSWRMMLRGKTVGLRYYLTDPSTGQTREADIREFLNPEQQSKFAKDPKMILDLAHGLATEYRRKTGKDTEVRALVLASLNGRKPQLMIDPAVNLAAVPKFSIRLPWIVPLREPLRPEPWTVPLDEWERHVDVTDLPFLKKAAHTVSN